MITVYQNVDLLYLDYEFTQSILHRKSITPIGVSTVVQHKLVNIVL